MKRVTIIHWKPDEAGSIAESLREAGFEPLVVCPEGGASLRQFGDPLPVAFAVDLSRLPLQGRAVAISLRQRTQTRLIPLVFVGGAPEKVEAVRALLPDAEYCSIAKTGAVVKKVLRNALSNPVVPDTMAGYSGTPLPRKLGIKPGTTVLLVNAPDGFEAKLKPMPEAVTLRRQAREADRVLLFVRRKAELPAQFTKAASVAIQGGCIWIIWPKKAAGTKSDVDGNVVREFGLSEGWVDYKVCAVDETWSGLAFARKRVK